jgi:DNA replication protein DnaC
MTDEHELREALGALGLRALSADLDGFLATVAYPRAEVVAVLDRIVQAEREDRARRSLERRQTRSRIGNFKPIDDFDWSWPTSIDRDAVETALKLRFFDDGANIVVVGAHGLGKTMIVKNIAHQAILSGHTVIFTTAARMLGELSGIDSPSKLEARLKHYAQTRLLCVDEVGYLSYDHRAADLFFEIVTRRYESRKPMIVTTNLGFREWSTVFPQATCTIALVDRLTHRADVLKIQGKSWRRKEARERGNRVLDEEE